MALSCRGLPDPFHYVTLLTGDLGLAASGNG
jgi:type VI secretion system protein ImpM